MKNKKIKKNPAKKPKTKRKTSNPQIVHNNPEKVVMTYITCGYNLKKTAEVLKLSYSSIEKFIKTEKAQNILQFIRESEFHSFMEHRRTLIQIIIDAALNAEEKMTQYQAVSHLITTLGLNPDVRIALIEHKKTIQDNFLDTPISPEDLESHNTAMKVINESDRKIKKTDT